jgi:hypothetical protein
MNGNEIVDKYPLATAVIIEWLFAEIVKSCEDPNIPEDFKQYVKHVGVSIDKVATIIDKNPRMMFDALDAQSIFCEIACAVHSFGVKVYSKTEMHPYFDNIPTRIEADRHAVELGFSILENQLTVTQE